MSYQPELKRAPQSIAQRICEEENETLGLAEPPSRGNTTIKRRRLQPPQIAMPLLWKEVCMDTKSSNFTAKLPKKADLLMIRQQINLPPLQGKKNLHRTEKLSFLEESQQQFYRFNHRSWRTQLEYKQDNSSHKNPKRKSTPTQRGVSPHNHHL